MHEPNRANSFGLKRQRTHLLDLSSTAHRRGRHPRHRSVTSRIVAAETSASTHASPGHTSRSPSDQLDHSDHHWISRRGAQNRSSPESRWFLHSSHTTPYGTARNMPVHPSNLCLLTHADIFCLQTSYESLGCTFLSRDRQTRPFFKATALCSKRT